MHDAATGPPEFPALARARALAEAAVWLAAVPAVLVAAHFSLWLACEAWSAGPIRGRLGWLPVAGGGRGLAADALAASVLAVPATAAGCGRLLWRGARRGEIDPRACGYAAIYAALAGPGLTACGVTLLRAYRSQT